MRPAGRVRVASASVSCSCSRRLLIHGTADVHIPPAHSQAIHEAAREGSELLLLPGLDHGTVCSDPRTEQRIVSFLLEGPAGVGQGGRSR